MSDRNWVSNLTFGCLAIALLVVIGTLCAKIAISDYNDINRVYAQYQQNADDDMRATQLSIKRECIAGSPEDISQCASVRLQEYFKKQSTQADLQAQKDMALWAKYMFFASIAGIPVTILGLLYVRRTFHEARLTTKAAIESVEVARKSNEAQSRAWLSVECTLSRLPETKTNDGRSGCYFMVSALVRNHGNSPATAVGFHVEIGLTGKNFSTPKEKIELFCDKFKNDMNFESDAIFPSSEKIFTHAVFLPDSEINIGANATPDFPFIFPVVYGCINYRTPYSYGVKQTKFAYFVTKVIDGRPNAISPKDSDFANQSWHLAEPSIVIAD